jgi:hypothetical protein|nr:MAG TPA: hypothetical protein [Caudoviricetes sp.]
MNIKYWWFKKKIQFLHSCVKHVDRLYNKYCKKHRVPMLGEIDDITPEEARELFYFLQSVRDLEYDIWKVYHAIDDN